MRAVLAPVGSRGDVQPMVALGQRMQAAGHDVTLAVAENYRPLVVEVGLKYARGGRDVESVIRERGTSVTNPLTFLRLARELSSEQLTLLHDACEGADLLVGTLLLTAGTTVAEKLGIPLVLAGYFPATVPTAEHPAPLAGLASGPRWLNRATWALQRLVVNVTLRGPMNAERAQLGLSPLGELERALLERHSMLLATDEELAPAPKDWTIRHDVTGFWFLDSPAPLPAELVAFLDAGEAPVYIGFGSMPNDEAEAQTEIIARACESVGCRALVSAGWGGLGAGLSGPRVLGIGPVNHRLLFERVAAIVHHGGAGTTAAAARAGVPQCIAPHIFDQFYWASRVAALGLGPPTLPTRFSAEELARALEAALSDAPMKERAAELGARLRSYSGVSRAVELLEQRLAEG